MQKPIFILGCGAQKSGTSWLFEQLIESSIVNMGLTKEYHVWDAVFSDLGKEFIVHLKKNESEKSRLKRLMQTIPGVYETYFANLITSNIRYTGDITPAYAMLCSDDFLKIKLRLETAGFLVKVIFLMRDPCERNWSALRMLQRDQLQDGVEISDETLNSWFVNTYTSPEMIARTKYNKTVTELYKSFDADQIYIGFFESLFTNSSVKKLSNFLNLDLSYVNLHVKINASKKICLDPLLRTSCREFYKDVYEFCAHKYPETKILWKEVP